MNTKSDSEKLKPCLKSSKALDGSHAYNLDGICINCGERWEKDATPKKGLEINACSKCRAVPTVSDYWVSIFAKRYFITCCGRATKTFRSPEKAVRWWNTENRMYIVELEKGVWLASWIGDPGRTLKMEHALEFETKSRAELNLRRARHYRPFVNAKVVKI